MKRGHFNIKYFNEFSMMKTQYISPEKDIGVLFTYEKTDEN